MKKLFLTTIFLFIGGTVLAQPYFNRNIISVTADNEDIRGDLAFADIDGDGDMDVLATMHRKLAWFENLDGMGNYGSQQYITYELDWAHSVYAADFDGDGDLDVLSASMWGNKGLSWFENLDGQGSFGPLQLINSIQSSKAIAADFDYDGDMDIVSITDNHVKLFINSDGLGSFYSGINIASVWSGTNLDVNDINSDGYIDVLASTGNANEIFWLENIDGTGSFGFKQVLSETDDYFTSTSSGDLDGDGDQDVISGSNDGLRSYENLDGLGNFGNMELLSDSIRSLRDIDVVDFDLDGDSDIIFASTTLIGWFENLDGLGTFSDVISIYQLSGWRTYFDIADSNIDGDLDLVIAANYRIALFDNDNGNQNFIIKDELYQSVKPANEIISYDIDIDGDQDVFVGDDSGKISLFKNLNGTGDFEDQIVISQINGTGVDSLFLSDLDGDGDMDLLASSGNSGKFSWHNNLDGFGNFGPAQIISSDISWGWRILATDIDGDGDNDVLCFTNYLDAGVHWFENIDGSGNFEFREMIIQDINFPRSISIDDIDGDGDIDIVVGSENKVRLIENQNASSSEWNIVTMSVNQMGNIEAMLLDDLDLDDNKDLILGGNNGLRYYTNIDLNGNYDEVVEVGTAEQISDITIADLDGDGDMDLATTGYSSHDVIWYENVDGNGTFGPNNLITDSEKWSFSITTADINNDSKMDILTTARFRGRVSWFENSEVLSIGNITVEGFVIYPNPTSGILNIKHPFPVESVTIYNQLGQRVLWFSSEASIDLSNLDSGLYFIEIVDDQQNIAVQRVIKS